MHNISVTLTLIPQSLVLAPCSYKVPAYNAAEYTALITAISSNSFSDIDLNGRDLIMQCVVSSVQVLLAQNAVSLCAHYLTHVHGLPSSPGV